MGRAYGEELGRGYLVGRMGVCYLVTGSQQWRNASRRKAKLEWRFSSFFEYGGSWMTRGGPNLLR